MADKPVTREEKYLARLTGDYTGELTKPITRKEKYLYELCLKGMGGEISPEEVKAAVNEYLEKNPVKPGATTEQAQQIEQNKTDITSLKTETGSLKEDISDLKTDVQNAEDALTGKISKFYATNNGENHLADSDDGKIADMMVYGKSEQKKYQGYQLLEHNTSEYNFTATTSYYGLVDNASENIKSGAYYLRKLGNTPTVLIAFLSESKETVKQEYLTNNSEKQITLEKDVAYVKYIIQNLTVGTTYKGTVKLILASTSGADYEPYVGGIPSPSPDYPQEIKSVVNPVVKLTNEDGLKVQSVTLNNITLNAIPVSSGGNVTINGQQYVADYVDVEKGKLYRKVKRLNLKDVDDTRISFGFHSNKNGYLSISTIENINKEQQPISNQYKKSTWTNKSGYVYIPSDNIIVFVDDRFTDKQTAIKLVQDTYVIYVLTSQTEEELSLEQIKSLKSLSTYYPTTNISVNSEQLDGYTVFNYPISMANGWNYVKQQLNDNRDYIYDMDSRTQDIDIQAAEAYVNSEYAVALTELEV